MAGLKNIKRVSVAGVVMERKNRVVNEKPPELAKYFVLFSPAALYF